MPLGAGFHALSSLAGLHRGPRRRPIHLGRTRTPLLHHLRPTGAPHLSGPRLGPRGTCLDRHDWTPLACQPTISPQIGEPLSRKPGRAREAEAQFHIGPELVIRPNGGPVLTCDSIEEIAAVPLTKPLQDLESCGKMAASDRPSAESASREAQRTRLEHSRNAQLQRIGAVPRPAWKRRKYPLRHVRRPRPATSP